MGLFNGISSLLGKESDYSSEYKRFRKAVDQHPSDEGLRFQFIKFCLLNRITGRGTHADHIQEALGLFESIQNSEAFDLQCHYLVGKYYQEEKNPRKAYQVYLDALKRFNRMVTANPGLKNDNADQAYSVSLNLMTLQSDPVDPEVEKCFKTIRKSLPLNLKRIEFDAERAKPVPDPIRIKHLAAEIRKLKADEDKTSEGIPAAQITVSGSPTLIEPQKADPGPRREPTPTPIGSAKSGPGKLEIPLREIKEPVRETRPTSSYMEPPQGVSYMAHENNMWLGPYTPTELQTMGFLKATTWVCLFGTQNVVQAFEVPDLQAVLQQPVITKPHRSKGAVR